MDTVTLKLTKEQAGNIDLLAEIPLRLKEVSQHLYSTGLLITGKLGNMNVSVNENRVKVENSLTKYYLGNNIQALRRQDIEKAIYKLSDELHVPMQNADVVRFDYAKNITLKHEIQIYLPYLGESGRYTRYPSKKGINYIVNSREFVIYDKIAELKRKRETVPPLYVEKNIMRLEKKYLNKITKYFNRTFIKASDLYEEKFYMEIINDWHKDYLNINKLNNTKLDMSKVKTKTDYLNVALVEFVKIQGGELAALQQIHERQSKRELTKKQAFDLRNVIKESSKLKIVSTDNELITELNSKVKEAIEYYR